MSEAIFGFIGVLVGGAIPWMKEALDRRRSRTEKGKFLAVHVVGILDEFAEECVEVVGDNGTEMGRPSQLGPDGQGYCYPVVKSPDAPNFPNDIDWTSTDDKLMYRALKIAGKLRALNNYVSHLWKDEIASPPDYSEYFEPRQEGFANLALEAMDIAAKLRKYHKLPEKEAVPWNKEWDTETYLKEHLSSRAARQIERDKLADSDNFWLPSDETQKGVSE